MTLEYHFWVIVLSKVVILDCFSIKLIVLSILVISPIWIYLLNLLIYVRILVSFHPHLVHIGILFLFTFSSIFVFLIHSFDSRLLIELGNFWFKSDLDESDRILDGLNWENIHLILIRTSNLIRINVDLD